RGERSVGRRQIEAAAWHRTHAFVCLCSKARLQARIAGKGTGDLGNERDFGRVSRSGCRTDGRQKAAPADSHRVTLVAACDEDVKSAAEPFMPVDISISRIFDMTASVM